MDIATHQDTTDSSNTIHRFRSHNGGWPYYDQLAEKHALCPLWPIRARALHVDPIFVAKPGNQVCLFLRRAPK